MDGRLNVCERVVGRGVVVPKYPKGNFLGPTVLEGVTVDMDCYKEEVFAPVLSCMKVLATHRRMKLEREHTQGTPFSDNTPQRKEA